MVTREPSPAQPTETAIGRRANPTFEKANNALHDGSLQETPGEIANAAETSIEMQ